MPCCGPEGTSIGIKVALNPTVWSVSCGEEYRHRRISIRVPGGISGGSSGPPLGFYLHGSPGPPHSEPPSMRQGMDRCASQTHFASRQNRLARQRIKAVWMCVLTPWPL